MPGTGAVSGGSKPGAEVRDIAFDRAVLSVQGLAADNHRVSAVRADQLSGEQSGLGWCAAISALFRRLIDFLHRLPQLRLDNGLVRVFVGNPLRFRFVYHRLVLVGPGTGAVLGEGAEVNIIVQKAFDGCISPQLGTVAAAFAVVDRPMPAGRENSSPVQGGGDFPIGHAGIAHLIDLPHNGGGFLVQHQPVLIFLAFAVAVGGIGGNILAAFLFGVKDRPDFTGQVFEMVVVHQAAEVQHISVVALAVQTVQHRNEPAAKAGEHHVCVPAHLYKVAPQAGKVLHQNQVNQAMPCVLQHLQKSGALKISSAVPIVPIGLNLDPAVEHGKFGEDFVLVLDAHRFLAGNVVFGLCGVGGVIDAQAAVDAHLILLRHSPASLPAPVPYLHTPHSGNAP